jgi:hypothetical protein
MVRRDYKIGDKVVYVDRQGFTMRQIDRFSKSKFIFTVDKIMQHGGLLVHPQAEDVPCTYMVHTKDVLPFSRGEVS